MTEVASSDAPARWIRVVARSRLCNECSRGTVSFRQLLVS